MLPYTPALPLHLEPKDVVSEQGVTFAAITVVLVAVGLVSGIEGVLVMAGITAFAAAAFTVATIIASISATDSTEATPSAR